jgi:hypothetical protein
MHQQGPVGEGPEQSDLQGNVKGRKFVYYKTCFTTPQAEKLRAYRFCDNVWTFVMENVDFRDPQRPIEGPIDRVKIVACSL